MKSTCYLCDKQVETEELEVGQYPICDECVKRMEDKRETLAEIGGEMSKMEFKAKTATEALEKIANAPLEHHWGCDQILIDGLHFSMDDVQDYAKATINNQTKLHIPKKIAEELLEGDKIKHPSYELMFNEDGEWSEELQEWMETTDKWWAIVDAYLAGKALGVELVEEK